MILLLLLLLLLLIVLCSATDANDISNASAGTCIENMLTLVLPLALPDIIRVPLLLKTLTRLTRVSSSPSSSSSSS